MRIIIVTLMIVTIMGCAGQIQKMKKTELCYDLESCQMSCTIYKDEESCNNLKYFK